MKKKSAVVKLSVISVFILIGLVLSSYTFMSCYNTSDSDSPKGGIYAIYEADSDDNLDSKIKNTQERLLNLLIGKGYSKASVTIEETNKLRVEVPNGEDLQSMLKSLGKPADLRFVLQSTGETIITGDHVTNATAGYYETIPVINLSFNSEGAKKFGEATSNNIGGTIDIIIITAAGELDTISSARVESVITNGKAVITGIGSYENAENLADQILSGTFGVTLSLKEISAF